MTLERFRGVKFPLGQTVMTRGVADKVAAMIKDKELSRRSKRWLMFTRC